MVARRIAAALSVALLSLVTWTAAASASTPGCVTNGFCGTQQHITDGLVMDSFHVSSATNNPVIAFAPNSGTDQGTDWINRHPTSGPEVNVPQAKTFEFAPGGNPSGKCASDPGPGFGTIDKIVLRPCNDSRFQVWVPSQAPAPNAAFFSWMNTASHQFLTSNGLRGQLTDVKDGAVGTPGNNQPTFDPSQLWRFVQQPAVV